MFENQRCLRTVDAEPVWRGLEYAELAADVMEGLCEERPGIR